MRTFFRNFFRRAIVTFASVVSLTAGVNAAEPSAYRLVPQVGHGDHADAIAIAPGGKWFATAGPAGIVVWDMRSDTVLRELPDSRHMKSLAISRDGAVVLAKTQDGKTLAWSAASGESITPSSKGIATGEWSDTEHPEVSDLKSSRDYIAKIGAEPVLAGMKSDINLMVLGTNVRNVVEIDYHVDNGPSVTAAFFKVNERRLLVKYTPPDGGNCGEPQGTFAFDGRHLVLSPTAWDASHFFADAKVIDAATKPLKSVWQHSCQDYMFANIGFDDGLVLAQNLPEDLIVWDPISATALARFNNVNTAASDTAAAIAVNRAHGVVALSAFGPDERYPDGNKVGVSIARSGKQSFIRTRSGPSEVRLSPDARTVYAKVGDQWRAWDVASSVKVAVGTLPAAPSKPERGGDRREDEWTRNHAFRRIDVEPLNSERYRTEVRDASRRVTMAVNARLHLCADSKHGWSEARSRGQGIDYWDLASGRLLWTASDAFAVSGKETGLLVEFADGRVKLSKGAESLVAMVKGFEHRPFDPKRDAVFIER
jgi:hypothetical protein